MSEKLHKFCLKHKSDRNCYQFFILRYPLLYFTGALFLVFVWSTITIIAISKLPFIFRHRARRKCSRKRGTEIFADFMNVISLLQGYSIIFILFRHVCIDVLLPFFVTFSILDNCILRITAVAYQPSTFKDITFRWYV